MRKIQRYLLQAMFVPLLAVGLLATTGCSTQDRAAAVAGLALMSETRSADFTLQSGDVEASVKSVDLSGTEIAQVDKAFRQYSEARSNLGRLTDDLSQLPSIVETVSAERARLEEAYTAVAEVVSANWEAYDGSTQADLSRWRREAFALNYSYDSFMELLDAPPSPLTQHDVLQSLISIVQSMALRG